ncbi:MAG: hypothetical protein PHE51_08505 [Eubacteriales bacterium]|nr:hypothetical protein [Eubacteriales bacterium]
MPSIFSGMDFWNTQSELVQYWFLFTLVTILPIAIVAISAIARIFCKKTLIITGAVLILFLIIDLLFFRDPTITLWAVLYYFISYIGCFITIVAEWVLKLINKIRGKTDVDAYGRPVKYSSGAIQGKKPKHKKQND